MKVTVATLSDTVFTLDVAADMEVENFKVGQFLVFSSSFGHLDLVTRHPSPVTVLDHLVFRLSARLSLGFPPRKYCCSTMARYCTVLYCVVCSLVFT